MTDNSTEQAASTQPPVSTTIDSGRGRSGWTGWITFAGILMIISGALTAITGLTALFNDQWVVWGGENALILDITQWGWTQLIIGAIVLLTGIGLFSGNMVARTIAVIIASLSLIGNFFFIPVYPLWALVVIAIDVLVIYAVTTHGREMQRT